MQWECASSPDLGVLCHSQGLSSLLRHPDLRGIRQHSKLKQSDMLREHADARANGSAAPLHEHAEKVQIDACSAHVLGRHGSTRRFPWRMGFSRAHPRHRPP